MSFLQNAKIRSKILSLIIPICLVGVGGSLYMSSQYKAADEEYTNFIATDEVAVLELARVSRNLQSLAYRGYQLIVYDHKADYFAGLMEQYKKNTIQLTTRFDKVEKLVPRHKAEIDAFRKRAMDIVAFADKAVAFAAEGKDAEAQVQMTEADKLQSPMETDINK